MSAVTAPLSKITAACLQVSATTDMAANLDALAPMIREARGRGADFIATPEHVDVIVQNRERKFANAFAEDRHPALAFFRRMAEETSAWLLAGSLAVAAAGDGDERLFNRSFLLAPDGGIAARYDKIHMFDADPGDGEPYRESSTYRPGNEAVLAATPWGRTGLAVCYDLRFPHLFRALAKAGARVITMPAAFTVPTGRLHWHVLLRARAIETGCFILAPAQCGEHDGGRRTFGHALIVAPNGAILQDAGDRPGIVMAELDFAEVAAARHALPSLTHDREFRVKTVEADNPEI